MASRHRASHRVFRAFILLCITVFVLAAGADILHGLYLAAILGAIPLAYVVGRIHQNIIQNRQWRNGREYALGKHDPVNSIRILPHTETPEPTRAPESHGPRPYTREEILRDPRSGARKMRDQ